jgi:hypothetical protein
MIALPIQVLGESEFGRRSAQELCAYALLLFVQSVDDRIVWARQATLYVGVHVRTPNL